MLDIGRKILWTQDWLRRIRSEQIHPVEPTGQNDAAIATQQCTLDDAGYEIITHDDEDDFVVVYANDRKGLSNAAMSPHVKATISEICLSSISQRPADDCEEPTTPQASAHLLELCGRGDHNHSFQDLRSASQAKKRDKATRQKYYSFKHVKPGDVGTLHYGPDDFFDTDRELLSERPKIIMAKSELYRQAQLWPRPPKYHHRHVDKIYGTLSYRVDVRREERKHGKAILEGHLRDFDTNLTHPATCEVTEVVVVLA